MVECPIPQDILKYKPKFIMNLSVRETVCGALGIGLGLLCYFSWAKDVTNQDTRMFLSFLVIMPFFLLGFVKIYEQPFEKIALTLLMENFIYPPKRKKEVHHPELEKYEKSRAWMIKSDDGLKDIEGFDKQNNKKKAQKKSSKKEESSQKIKIKKSDVYKAIK